MEKGKIYAGLDIGQTFTKLVIGTVHNDKFHICGTYMAPSRGINDGEITSKPDLKTTINSVLQQASDDGVTVTEVVLVLPSQELNVTRKNASIKITRNPAFIQQADIDELYDLAASHQIREHEIVVGIYPISYEFDNNKYASSQIMGALINSDNKELRLDTFIHALPIGTAKGLIDLVEEMNITVLDAIVSPVAYTKLLKETELKNSCFILDLGNTCCTVSLVINGLVCNNRKTKKGMSFILNELVKVFPIDYKVAKELLVKYGSSLVSKASDVVVYKDSVNHISIREIEIVQVVENALSQILNEAKSTIEFINQDSEIPVILVGGGSNLYDICEKSNMYLERKVSKRFYEYVGGKNSMYSAAIGACLHILEKNRLINITYVR